MRALFGLWVILAGAIAVAVVYGLVLRLVRRAYPELSPEPGLAQASEGSARLATHKGSTSQGQSAGQRPTSPDPVHLYKPESTRPSASAGASELFSSRV